MNVMATRPGNRKDQSLAAADRRSLETTMGGREIRDWLNFAVLGIFDGGSRTGETCGWLYGPNAEEVGGTFNLGSANSRHIGAFGGKKQ